MASHLISAGQLAPDVTLQDEHDLPVTLSGLWRSAERGVVLAFLRQYGWLFAKHAAAQLRGAHPELTRRGYTVVAVGQGPGSRSADFAREHTLPFVVLGDPGRAGYAAFGLERASILDVVKPALAIAAVKALVGGSGLSATDGDPAQRPGTFVVDRRGIVRHAHPGAHAGDTPSSEELIRVIDALDRV